MTPYVRILLFANIGVFFLQSAMPGFNDRPFAFFPPAAIIRPWTFVTYMFLHAGLMHLAFNMIALFFFGPRVEERIGSSAFLRLYFISGITGALLSLFLGPTAFVVGASGAVFGVMLAFAIFWPDTQILLMLVIPVPARMLVILTTIMALFGGFSGASGGVAHFAHLGGYLGAWLYLKYQQRGRDSFRKRAQGAPKPREIRFTAKPKVDIEKVHEVNRAEVNRILDKISAHGMSALTDQERLFLSNFSATDDRPPPVS